MTTITARLALGLILAARFAIPCMAGENGSGQTRQPLPSSLQSMHERAKTANCKLTATQWNAIANAQIRGHSPEDLLTGIRCADGRPAREALR